MPKLWNETIEAHRNAVRDAILKATAALVAEHGLTSVKMAKIAEQVGIGRATLYKYFPDVEAILVAWHEDHVKAHLAELAELRDRAEDPEQALHSVLTAYAFICHHRGNDTSEIAALVHRGEPIARAQRQLTELFSGLLARAAADGRLHSDAPSDELANYCLHALAAAAAAPDPAAVHRLVDLTIIALGLRTDRHSHHTRPPDAHRPRMHHH
ncbi:TetR/AcrR family transcriptional regulator [Streptomyces sp. NPDC058424]|uniref:TetR/AcrR family transcriptional regulator n=1 Tax=Streptomyces sp. NPDC058424 TaxID=3346491 RepID=UPI0036522CD4